MATSKGRKAFGCFVIDPRLEESSGARRLAYLFDALRALNEALDGNLLVVRGRPDVEIPRLAELMDADAVHCTDDFSPFGRRRDEAVADALAGLTRPVPLEPIDSPYAVAPGDITKPDGTAYKVFTPYYKRWRDEPIAAAVGARAVLQDPATLKGTKRIRIPAAPVKSPVVAGEQPAQTQFADFLDGEVDRYNDARDRPDLAATSRMSVHLKFGAIHPRGMLADLHATRRARSSAADGVESYVRELAFRDFYADVLFHWPHSAWRNWNDKFDGIELDTDADARRRFDRWCAGQTGFPLVDAGMRQLAETGFMHNRVRMLVASFLVKDLHLPWWWGARWFLEQLVDGDIASNQHGWQWAAGTGTDASPYFRVFNPETQRDKFDPNGSYVRRWVPEIDTDDYPAPMVDHKAEREEALRRFRQL